MEKTYYLNDNVKFLDLQFGGHNLQTTRAIISYKGYLTQA